jgi:hypothetical protein
MELYPDTGCPACEGRHTLSYAGRKPHQDGVAYRYTCPATKVLIVLRPKRSPKPVAAAPADAVPMERVSG